jgi:hypothetical protein
MRLTNSLTDSLWLLLTYHSSDGFLSATQSLLCLANFSPFITSTRPEYKSPCPTVNCPVILFVVKGMHLLIFVAAETSVCLPLPSKLTTASVAIPAFKPCLPSRLLVMDYSIKICFDSHLKQLLPFLVLFYNTFVIMYPKERSYMANGSVKIEKHIKTYLLNTCVFNVNPGNQDSPMTFSTEPLQS